MPVQSPYQTYNYPDSKSEATYVDDRRMPTPWEGEVHELRDRVTGQYPTRPRNYGPTDEYIRQLRADTADYHSSPSRRSSKAYDTLCCGSKAGIFAWVIAILGIVIALAVLLIKVLKPEAFAPPAAASSTSLEPTTVTMTASSPSVSISTSTVSTFSTETESTVSTTTLTTETTASTTTTQTYTPPSTATETETSTQTSTSVATYTPPEPDTVTSTPEPSTLSVTTTSILTTSQTTTASTTLTMPTTATEISTMSNDDEEGGDEGESGGGDKRGTTSTTRDSDTSSSSLRRSSGSAATSQSSGTTSIASTSILTESTSSSGPVQPENPLNSGGGTAMSSTTLSTTKANARRQYNFFARAAPLTTLGTPIEDSPEPTSLSDNTPTIVAFSDTTITLTAYSITSNSHLPRSLASSPPFSPATCPSTHSLFRRVFDSDKALQIGTHAAFFGMIDCVKDPVMCEAALVLVGMGAGALIGFVFKWQWRRILCRPKKLPEGPEPKHSANSGSSSPRYGRSSRR